MDYLHVQADKPWYNCYKVQYGKWFGRLDQINCFCLFSDYCNHQHWPNTLPDVVFILDSSRGQGDTYFQRQIDYVEKFVSYFDVGPSYFQFSVITYNFHATKEISLGAHTKLASLTDAIKNIGYTSGPSYTHLGLRMAREDTSGRRSGRPGHVIVLSDGLSSNMVMY